VADIAPETMSIREKVLLTARDLTVGDRNSSYGSPTPNHNCLAELMTVYRKFSKHSQTDGHEAAMFQVLTKISRIACGSIKEDNYVDGSAYFAIAYEAIMINRSENRG
jgi:Domain of unknown function (DUF6378)